jgi:ATP-binding cassette subfamily C (CFTR/MRP) protein 1
MSIVDGELPFALIDLVASVLQTVMGALLMCISAGYFSLTMPAVAFVVWGMSYSGIPCTMVTDICCTD